jgi:hypothetical protein
MRRIAFALTMLMPLTPLAAAQGDGFAVFWKEFSAAAARKDKDKIRALTLYPSPELNEKNFDRIWKEMFPPAMLRCLAKAKPERTTSQRSMWRSAGRRSTPSNARRRAGASRGRIPTIDGTVAVGRSRRYDVRATRRNS